MLHTRLTLLFITSLLCCFATADESLKTVKLAAEDNWAPFAKASGTGVSHSLINRAFSTVGVKVDSIVVPYSRAVVMAKEGLVDGVFNLVKEQSTESEFIFGKQPLFSATASFYHKISTPVKAKDKWQLPPNTKVGIIRGYEYGDELKQLPNIKLITLSNHNQLINLLLLDRIDVAIMYDLVAKQYITQMGVSQEIEQIFTNHTGQVYLAFSKLNPHASKLAELLDRGLTTLKDDGSYQEIMASAGSPSRN